MIYIIRKDKIWFAFIGDRVFDYDDSLESLLRVLSIRANAIEKKIKKLKK